MPIYLLLDVLHVAKKQIMRTMLKQNSNTFPICFSIDDSFMPINLYYVDNNITMPRFIRIQL